MRFLMIDRIVAMERGRRATGIKNVSMSEDFLTHHFPDTPVMPGALLAEAGSQLASWLIRDATDFKKLGMPVELERVRFGEIVEPGDQLLIEVSVQELSDATGRFRAVIRREDKKVASGRFKMALVDAAEYESEVDARRMFEVLTKRSRRSVS